MSQLSRRPGRRRRVRATYQTRPIQDGSASYSYENLRRGIKLQPVDPGTTDEQTKHNRAHGPTPVRQAWTDPLGGEHRTWRVANAVCRKFGHEPGAHLPVLIRIVGR